MILNPSVIGRSSYETTKISVRNMDDSNGIIQYYDCFGNEIASGDDIEVILGSVVYAVRENIGGVSPYVEGSYELLENSGYKERYNQRYLQKYLGAFIYRVTGECEFGYM